MSVELTLPGKDFYLLEAPMKNSREISIHLGMPTAIAKIREYISTDIPTDKISLVKVTVDPDQLKAVGIPWSTIAVELIKKG